MTPGKNEKHYLAGALHLTTGRLRIALSRAKTMAYFGTS